MSPPDWNQPYGNPDFLGVKRPDLLTPEVYAKILSERFSEYHGELSKLDEKVKQLVAEDFPPRHEDVKVETSGPQGKVKPLTIIDDPADWKAESWKGREAEFTYRFTEEDIAEIDAAIQGLKARGLKTEEDIKGLTKADFPLPKLGPKLVALARNVSHGRGFQFIKGFPLDKYKSDQWSLIAAYWGIGLQIGTAQVTQTDYDQAEGKVVGSILNHVVNGGFKKVEGLGSKTSQLHQGGALSFHADQGATDIISLFCVGAAKEGGHSKWVSSIAIHNELLRRGRKDLVEVLSQPFKLPKRVTQYLIYKTPEGKAEYEDIVPFEYHDGYLSVYFQSLEYFRAKADGIQLTPLQEEAIWAVIALSERPEFHFRHRLEPGDIEWIHNPSIFHAREAYVDGEGEGEQRHLIRWWIHTHANKRSIAPSYAPRSSIAAGGGFKVPPGTKLRLPITPLGLQSS